MPVGAPLDAMRVEFHATLRDPVGERRIDHELADGATVGDALLAVADEYSPFRGLLFDGEGRIRPHVNVFVNGDLIADRAGRETELADGDTVGATPSVAGGSPIAGTAADRDPRSLAEGPA